MNQQNADQKFIKELARMSKAGKEASKAGEKIAEIVLKQAFTDTVTDCLKVLDRYDCSGVFNNPYVNWMEKEEAGDYIKVEDIEELFNIKL